MLTKTTTNALFIAALFALSVRSEGQRLNRINPSTLPKIAIVDRRFQSYNVEMVEVTGGRFWKPYSQKNVPSSAPASGGLGVGLSGDMFQYRPPIDLRNQRLRNLARALGPTYIRVSGSWRNATYFHDSDSPAPTTPPAGFNSVLTRAEWKGVVDFAKSVDAEIVTSVATSGGTRDKNGVWSPEQAEHFFEFTKSVGGNIAATEFMNEPTIALRGGGVPAGYSPAAFAQDIEVFRSWLRQSSPRTIFMGPGGEGEGVGWKQPPEMQRIPSEELLRATGPVFDVFSYHFYSAISSRCSGLLGGGVSPEEALSRTFLDIPERVNNFYTDLRDRYMPGKAIWVSETGEAACGGDRWASTFLDTFRYLNELGTLAKRGVQVVAHNTLVASDYALLDENTFSPRPDYWGAVLWHRLMGPTVLNAGSLSASDIRLYAHCFPGRSGAVTLLVINPRATEVNVNTGSTAEEYVLSSSQLDSDSVNLNGRVLRLTSKDLSPPLSGKKTTHEVTFLPKSITFLVFRDAANPACTLTSADN